MAEEFEYEKDVDYEAYDAEDSDIELDGPIDLDLTDVKTTPVENGWHHVEIKDVKADTSKPERGVVLVVSMEIIDEGDPDYNQYVFNRLATKGNGRRFTKMFLADGLGWTAADFQDYTSLSQIRDKLVGRELMVYTQQTKSNGNTYANVRDSRPVEYGEDVVLS